MSDNFPDSVPPLDNNSIMVGVIRSKPFMQFDANDPDYDGSEAEHCEFTADKVPWFGQASGQFPPSEPKE